jgi:hypothetical protein
MKRLSLGGVAGPGDSKEGWFERALRQIERWSVGVPVGYEEGLWTPILTTTGVDFGSVTYDTDITCGVYTKIGRVVYVYGALRTDSITVGGATGDVAIGGLPFKSLAEPAEARGVISIGWSSGWAGEEPTAALVRNGETSINLYYRTAADGDTAISAVADVGTGANVNLIYFGGFYFTA